MSLTAEGGRTLAILGPSGAGKTSLLRLLAGLEMPETGCVMLDGRDVTRLAPEHRGVALVTQHDSLFPHLTIFENLAFSMRLRHEKADAIERSVREYAGLFEIERFLPLRPAQISGGERQRAAIARALLAHPRVLLLDEPFAHLDPQLRVQVRRRFGAARRRFSGPVIQVTHDHAEATAIAGRLAIMMNGSIVQCGAPQEVYDFPATLTVAAFFGSPPMNLLDDGTVIEGIRPEHVRLDESGPLRGVVQEVEILGPDALVGLRTQRGEVVVRVLRERVKRLPEAGEEAGTVFPPQFVRRFNRENGKLIE